MFFVWANMTVAVTSQCLVYNYVAQALTDVSTDSAVLDAGGGLD